MSDAVSILDNGKKTYTFSYTVNGTKVRETLDLDVQNGNFGRTLSMKEDMGWGKGFNDISPNSELGQAIINGDDGGARQNAYLNTMDRISTLAAKQSLSNSTTYENALRESGMYETANGTVPISKEVPAVEHVIDGGVVSDDDSDNNEVVEVKDKGTPWKGKVLTYPNNAYYDSTVGPSQDYMKIDMFKYKAPQADYLGGRKTSIGTGDDKKEFTDLATTQASFSKTITGGLQTNRRTKEWLGTTRLPIPNLLGADNGVSWGTASANAFEAAAFMSGYNQLGALVRGQTNFGTIAKDIVSEGGKLATLLKAQGGDAAQLLTAQATKMALQQLNINTDTKQFITRAQGKAVNPNLETLFSAPKIRSFSFTFEFLPQNVEDASVIRQIMRFFKQGMLPARGSSGGAPGDLFLLSPNVFRLSYMNGKNRIRSLNTFKMCALTGCRVNYTPGGTWSAYDDPNAWSQPTASTMDLSFSELTPIFADDYEISDTNKERLKDQIEEQGPLQEWFNEEDIGF